MASEKAIELAVSAWQTPTTSDIEMNSRLAEAFADIIDKVFIDRPVIVSGGIAPITVDKIRLSNMGP